MTNKSRDQFDALVKSAPIPPCIFDLSIIKFFRLVTSRTLPEYGDGSYYESVREWIASESPCREAMKFRGIGKTAMNEIAAFFANFHKNAQGLSVNPFLYTAERDRLEQIYSTVNH